MGMKAYKNGFRLTLIPERLSEPLRRTKPTLYFVNSMSDLFHEHVPLEYIDRVFEVMEQSPRHTFQVLTKRPNRMVDFFRGRTVPRNVWLGVSVENRRHGLPRIELLRSIEAKVRFLSAEPLLEDLGPMDLSGIHWVIVGGESGPKARPMCREWVDNIKQQCRMFGVAFFFKQWGTWSADGRRRSKTANGRRFRGRVWDEMPAF
jgi:protein gp37